MLKLFITAAVIAGSTISANANALHLNPHQPAQAKNMRTFGKTTIPLGAYGFCKRNVQMCKNDPQALAVKLTRYAWDKIVKVNAQVNQRVVPMTDKDLFGVEELWTLPKDAGDCEDYALEKRRILSNSGFPMGSLRITVGYDEDGGGHAVLTVVTDAGDFILNNTEQRVLRWQDAEFTYLKRQAPGDLSRWESLRPS